MTAQRRSKEKCKMKLTRICVLILALVMCCTMFTACGGSDLDTGVFTVEASGDWNIKKRTLDGSERDDQVYVIKDGEDANSYANLLICYYKEPSDYKDERSFYKDAKDASPIEAGDRKWEGYTYSLFGSSEACFTAKEGSGLWVCKFTLDTAGSKISVGDDDVKDILASLKLD